VKSFLYLLVLLAVLVACVVLLRSIEEKGQPVSHLPAPRLAVESTAPQASDVDLDHYADAPADELYAAGVELLNLWHVREATDLFERALAADTSNFGTYVKLVECYSHPLIRREDEAGEAARRAEMNRRSDADTIFLAGLKSLYVDRAYATAAALLSRANNTEEDARYYSALAMFKVGRIDDAMETLRQAGETSGRVMELSIRCAVVENDFDTAREQAKELARSLAEEPYPYVLLALVELLNGNAQGAVEFCNNALVLDSKYIPAILARANLYAVDGEFEAARVSFEKLSLFEDPVLRALGMDGIGFVDLHTGRFDDGVAAIDEAIRFAMLAGSVRQGLTYAANLIGYLCELGHGDKAEEVIDRWVSGFGDIPMDLAALRIHVLVGDRDATRSTLKAMQSKKDWAVWMGMMSIDFDEMNALARIGEQGYDEALGILTKSVGTGPSAPGVRSFLKGYASFQNGDAENAAGAFAEVAKKLYGVEFPYRGNPILHVQSLFYLAEAGIAAGNEEDAAAQYERFLEYWGDADWDVQAVTRAREKLENLSPTP
jgi:tetratricopeptide (TPR) repeat protein